MLKTVQSRQKIINNLSFKMKNKKLFIIFALLASFITSIKAQTEIVTMTTTAFSVSIGVSWTEKGNIFANGVSLINGTNSTSDKPYKQYVIPIDGKVTLIATDNARLTKLYCDSIQLTNLSLNECPYLIELNCNYNNLAVLDLNKCTNLKKLSCS